MEPAAVITSPPARPAAVAPEIGEARADAGALLELLDALAAGRAADALAGLYDRTAADLYALALWRTGSAADAADAVQEVFVRLAARPQLPRQVRDPRAYLLAMARRAAVDLHRRRKGARTEPLDDLVLADPALSEPGADLAAGVDAGRVSRLLARLSPVQRESVYLRHFAGLTFAAIGRITGVPTFTAASRYRLGMARLRRLLGVQR